MNVDQIPYTITKAGLEMLAKQLAPGISHLGITINAVDPGPTNTGWMSEALKEEIRQESIVNEPHEVADAIFSLLLEDAASTTGKVVHVGR
jgi:3-oxoacyl-[acyl-carrier protein] reductase